MDFGTSGRARTCGTTDELLSRLWDLLVKAGSTVHRPRIPISSDRPQLGSLTLGRGPTGKSGQRNAHRRSRAGYEEEGYVVAALAHARPSVRVRGPNHLRRGLHREASRGLGTYVPITARGRQDGS